MLEEAPFSLDILPSAMMDIVRTQYFYDSLECGLGSVFRDYIVGEVDKLVDEYSRHCARHKIFQSRPVFSRTKRKRNLQLLLDFTCLNLGAVGLPVRYLWYNIHR